MPKALRSCALFVCGEHNLQPSTARFVDTLRAAAQRSAVRAEEAIAQGRLVAAYDLIAAAYAAMDRVFELQGRGRTHIVSGEIPTISMVT